MKFTSVSYIFVLFADPQNTVCLVNMYIEPGILTGSVEQCK